MSATIPTYVRTMFAVLFWLVLAGSLRAQQPPLPADELFEQAFVSWLDTNHENALRLFEKAAIRYRKENNWLRYSESLLYQANILRAQREHDISGTRLDDAVETVLTRYPQGDPMLARLYAEAALLKHDTGDVNRSVELAGKAVELADSLQAGPLDRIRVLAAWGEIHYAKGAYEEALKIYADAGKKAVAIENSWKRTYANTLLHNNIGVLHRRLGRLEEAMASYKRQRVFLGEIYRDDHPLIATNHNNIGALYYLQGDVGVAAHHFLRTADLMERNYGPLHPLVAAAYNNAGGSFIELGMVDEATRYLERAQEIKIKLLGDRHVDTALGYSNLAALYMQQEDLDRALDFFNRSLNIRLELFGSGHPDLVTIYLQRGRLYMAKQMPEAALEDFMRALRIGKERLGESHPDVSAAYLNVGGAFRRMGHYEKALNAYDESLRRLVQKDRSDGLPNVSGTEYPGMVLDLLSARGKLLEQQFRSEGDLELLKEAHATFRRAIRLIGEMQINFLHERSKLSLISRHHSIFGSALSLTEALYRRTGDAVYLEEAYVIMEKSKARLVQESMADRTRNAVEGVPEEVGSRDHAIRKSLASLRHEFIMEWESNGSGSERSGTVQEELLGKHLEWQEWIAGLRSDYPDFYRSRYQRPLTDLKTIRQEVLSEDQLVLNYFMGDDEIYLHLLGRERMELHRIEFTLDMPEKLEKLFLSIETEDKERFAEYSHRLYKLLIEPVSDQLAGYRNLLILPDYELYYLPFDLLLKQPAESGHPWNWPYLIHSHTISYAPSLEVYFRTRHTTVSDEPKLLALAPWADPEKTPALDRFVSSMTGELSPLPMSSFEVEQIASAFRRHSRFNERLFGRWRTDMLINNEASSEELLTRDLSSYRYIHLATHAYIHEAFPTLSAIILAGQGEQPGIVYLNDVSNLGFQAELLVLSGCETGRGSLAKGEGVIGFSRAFLQNGVKNLMVSMWRVNDRSSATLMARFYEELFAGSQSSEALRQAKLSMIRSSETAFPSEWAAFILIGG